MCVDNNRTRQTFHQTRKEAETQMFAQFWMSEKDSPSGTQLDAQRGHQS